MQLRSGNSNDLCAVKSRFGPWFYYLKMLTQMFRTYFFLFSVGHLKENAVTDIELLVDACVKDSQ